MDKTEMIEEIEKILELPMLLTLKNVSLKDMTLLYKQIKTKNTEH